jgi:IclR family transcriptional regulator, KDG regulon repressor
MARDDGPSVESVDRALRVLAELAEHGAGISLDDLAEAMALPKSSLHRTLAALRERGFAGQRDDGRYTIGSELLRIAFRFHDRMDVRLVWRPVLERVRDACDETVHLGVLDGADVVYVDKLESSHPVTLTSRIGGRNPAHCTGVGKALLAWTYPTEDALTAWIERVGPLARKTDASILDRRTLQAQMAKVRRDGFATDLEESELGVRCVGAPVFLGASAPAAAVSIAAPKERMPVARMRTLGLELARACAVDALAGSPSLDPGRAAAR